MTRGRSRPTPFDNEKVGLTVEVRIGVQNVAREITFETTLTADELVAAVKAARSADVLELTDDKGGRVIVPTSSIGYVTDRRRAQGGRGLRRPLTRHRRAGRHLPASSPRPMIQERKRFAPAWFTPYVWVSD